ncbi:MAG: hypothetical protein NTX61_02600 [Bacteroidetes bacterium]|nr:hypothetical protein [Bacteroidota bacterium]
MNRTLKFFKFLHSLFGNLMAIIFFACITLLVLFTTFFALAPSRHSKSTIPLKNIVDKSLGINNNPMIKNDTIVAYLSQTDSTTKEVKLIVKADNGFHQGNINSKDDTISNILDVTNNTLAYFTFIIALIALIIGFAFYRFYREYLNLKEQVKNSQNSVLDAALTTISSVPFIEVTQITSCEHRLAVRSIAEIARNNSEVVLQQPKYWPLLLTEALDNWFNSETDYKKTLDLLQDAYKQAYRDSNGGNNQKQIAYHIARAYKQYAINEIKDLLLDESKPELSDKDLDKLAEADKYSELTFPEYKNVIKFSTSLIRYDFDKKHTLADSKKVILNQLRNIFQIDETIKESDVIKQIFKIVNADNSKTLDSFSKQSVMSSILLRDDIFPSNGIDNNEVFNAAKKLKLILEGSINDKHGYNIKTAWYLTIGRLLKLESTKCTDEQKPAIIENLKNYEMLCQVAHTNITDSKQVDRLFTADWLIEIPLDKFEKIREKLTLK